jgi:hypothetical protein
MATSNLVFVAYPSKDAALTAVIREGLGKASARSNAYQYEPWEFNDIAGTPLISPIIEKIDDSAFVVADITYLNLNVVYEIGYAIGRRKRVFLIRKAGIRGDKDLANRVGIFDTLGYFEYEESDSLSRRLTSHFDIKPLGFSDTVDHKAPAYVVDPPVKGDAATMMVSRLKKARIRYRSFNPSEDSRLSATDAIKQVAASAGALLAFENDSKEWAEIHNLRTMFVAGLVDGMEKPCLILAPAGFAAPLDVRDEVKFYAHPDDIVNHVAEIVLELTEYLQQVEPTRKSSANSLQDLSFGDPTAENEMSTLGSYYMRTEQFSRAMRGEVNLVVGRKGSGKTALFLQLRDQLRSDKRNIMVDLKPEGYQLIKLKEGMLQYLSEGSRQHLITAFWEYLLLLEVTYKVLEKDRAAHKHNHEIYDLYIDLEATYNTQGFHTEGDFSERLLMLSNQISEDFRATFGEAEGRQLTTNDVTGLIYKHDIKLLKQKLSTFLNKKRGVWILFDNLDKGWNTGGVDAIDTVVLRCLVEAGRKIERDMEKRGVKLHCLVFIRNDVYELLMKSSADYGKDMRAVLDWTDPDMLREMLRLRLVSGVKNGTDTVDFDTAWRNICVSHYAGEDTSAYMIDRSLMRPRNLLKILSHSKGFANNFNHAKIDESDIEKGVKAYSQDLLIELDHELTDVFPSSPDLLYSLLDHAPEATREQFEHTLISGGVATSELAIVFNFLLYYGVLGLKTSEGVQYIFDVNYDSKILSVRADRMGATACFMINPAFWGALNIKVS